MFLSSVLYSILCSHRLVDLLHHLMRLHFWDDLAHGDLKLNRYTADILLNWSCDIILKHVRMGTRFSFGINVVILAIYCIFISFPCAGV